MIKKITACILLLFANFILMALAVIPHHHHRQLVCIENVHCEEDGMVHKYSTSEHQHQHDANDSGDCILRRVIVLPSSEEKQVFELINSTDDLFWSGLYITGYITYETFHPYFSFTASFPQSNSLLSSCINTTLRLRAPPSV